MDQIDAIQLREQFGAFEGAALPGLYVRAKADLAECSRVDECKDWADKAEAIRSYARQAGDDELMHTAMRIKSRAVERLGAILEGLAKASGQRRDLPTPTQAGPTPRQEAIQNAGISDGQAERAQAVARFAKAEPDRYEEMVEGEQPATVTKLAREGRRPSKHRGASGGEAKLRALVAAAKRIQDLRPRDEHDRRAMIEHVEEVGGWATRLGTKLRSYRIGGE